MQTLPVGARHFLDHCWLQGRFQPTLTRIIRLRDVFIAGEGLVFDRDLRVVEASVTQQTAAQLEEARDALGSALKNSAIAERCGPSVLCIKPGQRNYGHWLTEMLPKAEVAAIAHPDLDLQMLVPSVDEPLRSVVRRSLELLGIDAGAVVHALETPEWCDDLIIVQGLTQHGIYMSPLIFRTLDKLAAAVPDQVVSERVYVKRSASFVRRLANEDAVLARMQDRGYVALSPETMTLDRQIAAFRGARQVVGVAGAGLSSIAFCRPRAEVTALYPENMPDTFFWFLAQHRDLVFNDIRCRLTGESRSHLPWDANISFDTKLFAWYMQ